jgi:uncharacterized protein (UPF0305 family)
VKVIKDLKPRHTEDVDGIYFARKKHCIKIPDNCPPGNIDQHGELEVSCNWKRFVPFDPLHPFGSMFPGGVKIVGPDFFPMHEDWPNPYAAENGWEGREKW